MDTAASRWLGAHLADVIVAVAQASARLASPQADASTSQEGNVTHD